MKEESQRKPPNECSLESTATDVRSESPRSILLLNQNWLKAELKALGHSVRSAGWVNTSFDYRFDHGTSIAEVTRELFPDGLDAVVYFDDSGPVTLLGLEELECPLIFYSVDAHHHVGWHKLFAGACAKTLVAQKNYLPQIQTYAKDAEWFPLWAPRDVLPEASKTIDVCFRGTLREDLHPRRARFFKQLSELVTIDVAEEPYYKSYPKSRIVVNQTVHGDLNFRVFEALYSGALLINPRIRNGMAELFVAGEDYVEYEEGNAEEAAELVAYYLAHPDERERIAAAGHRKARSNHAPAVRAAQLARYIQELPVTGGRPNRFTCFASTYLQSALNTCKGSRISDCSEARRRTVETFLGAAIRCLSKAVLHGEVVSSDTEVILLNTMALGRKMGVGEELPSLASDLVKLAPENVLVRFIQIKLLLDSRQQGIAETCAAELSDSPSELLRHVDRSIEEALASVSQTIATD